MTMAKLRCMILTLEERKSLLLRPSTLSNQMTRLKLADSKRLKKIKLSGIASISALWMSLICRPYSDQISSFHSYKSSSTTKATTSRSGRTLRGLPLCLRTRNSFACSMAQNSSNLSLQLSDKTFTLACTMICTLQRCLATLVFSAWMKRSTL